MTTQAVSQKADFTQQVGNVNKSAGRGSSGASFEQCMNKTVDSEKEQVYEKNKKSDCMDNNPQYECVKENICSGCQCKKYQVEELEVNDAVLTCVIQQMSEVQTIEMSLEDAMEQLIATLSEELGLSEEDIKNALIANDIMVFQLFDFENAQKFFEDVFQVNDFSEILMNSELSDAWQRLSESLSELELEVGDGIVLSNEELMHVVNQVKELVNSQQEDVVSELDVLSDDFSNLHSEATVNENQQQASEEQSGLFERSNGNQEVTTSQSHSLGESATPESMFQQFMDKVQSVLGESSQYSESEISQMHNISKQVIEYVKVNVKPDTTGLEIQLNPEQLGKVNVLIEMKEGVATANFIVRNEMARIAVETQLQNLRDTFEEQGLKVEAVEVTVSDFSFSQEGQMNDDSYNGNGSGKGKALSNVADVSLDEEIDEVEDSEGGINITA